ncbi:P-loop containing nucleoside triphosphate hydrolase protein [Aspergillus steynii IBT 23096]|uniref:P-loop containing nucleoside triphosphate hydrolase protein n=1 Tax=Aspergillus steynii IBT 23096 TaxID=1392250 RepID=A0A2I2GKB2_9EURO|nr:P-loop containing nucleoside triphosphate hydrolase protein [Aspergillus steynii IBT 23096]PLB53311.1 P-loop containing nucleoside triphosphate hydrolase protein [Aspergillus steynii IBT 23096]
MTANVKEAEAEAGSIGETYELYQSAPDEKGRSSWTHQMPKDLVAPAENSQSSKYALIVRKVKCYDGKRSLKVHSIIIQSEPLKSFLASVMKDYPGLTLTLNRLEMEAPFKPFVHRWRQLCEAIENEADAMTLKHAMLLHEVLHEELKDTISEKNDLIQNKVMTLDLLWALFEPGSIILSVIDGRECAFQFESGSLNRCGNFVISAKYIDWDGAEFGYSNKRLTIPAYEGTLPIVELCVYPLIFHGDAARIRKDLADRGKLWQEYKGYHYKQYDGPASGFDPLTGREMRLNIRSRIVIDTKAYNIFQPDGQISVSENVKGALSEEQQLIATPILRGYALKQKAWLEFFVDSVTDIAWNTKAFDSLVLPHAQQGLKRLILGIAQAQSNKSDTFDDVIQGKGRGVIMLLKGPPGVGKTLTAESVAEAMRVPLYILSAGDLGTDSATVESKMRDVMSMIPRWGAIILLDEADVFMEARDTIDLKRNELVSIFLRLLEYYEGILFLTTNRAEHIDPAFESRIHISIRYPQLSPESRRQIWSQFIAARNIAQFSEDELDQVSSLELNGRQIKNLLKTAHLMAQAEKCQLNYEHVRIVLDLRDSVGS